MPRKVQSKTTTVDEAIEALSAIENLSPAVLAQAMASIDDERFFIVIEGPLANESGEPNLTASAKGDWINLAYGVETTGALGMSFDGKAMFKRIRASGNRLLMPIKWKEPTTEDKAKASKVKASGLAAIVSNG